MNLINRKIMYPYGVCQISFLGKLDTGHFTKILIVSILP